MGVATPIQLTGDERDTLETWVRKTTTEQRMAQRARIVLEAAAGKRTKEVAALLQVRPATVSRWRTRFAQHRIAGLADAPRSGKPAKYDETTERRILGRLARIRLIPLGRLTPAPAAGWAVCAKVRSSWTSCRRASIS